MTDRLAEGIACGECRDLVREMFPGMAKVSRAAVFELHGRHRPMHPNEVGANHRREAAKAWAEWEALDPYNEIGA